MARDRRTPKSGDAMQQCGKALHASSRDHKGAAEDAGRAGAFHPRKVFVGGLAHKTTTGQLREHFRRFGSVADTVVLRWPDGRSRGFGYVAFADATGPEAVLATVHDIGGRRVDVKRAVPGTNKLFVGGLPQNTTSSELSDHFETFGIVSDAVVMIDPATCRSRGFGFVCFLPGPEGTAAVATALARYDSHRIRGKWIEVKNAEPPHKVAASSGSSEAGSAVAPSLSASTSEEDRAQCREKYSQPPPPDSRSGSASLMSPRKVALPAGLDLDLDIGLAAAPLGFRTLPATASTAPLAASAKAAAAALDALGAPPGLAGDQQPALQRDGNVEGTADDIEDDEGAAAAAGAECAAAFAAQNQWVAAGLLGLPGYGDFYANALEQAAWAQWYYNSAFAAQASTYAGMQMPDGAEPANLRQGWEHLLQLQAQQLMVS
mmetsp:Transcript_97869/g.281159  ORF Transcript_97869/g.281159 Transcript_97869/m.281159 type:complete len:433 (-) Transcript_97869:126-1424(-)